MKHTLLLFFFISTFTLFSQNKNHSIGFKENKGQIMDQKGKPNTAVKYLLNSNGLNVQLKKNGFSYDIYEVKKIPVSPSKTSKTLPYQIPEKDKDKKPEYNLEYKFHRVDIDFVNSNSKVELITDQQSKDFDNYYNVPDKPEGIVGVHQYKQITYKNIYPNIDVVFTIPDDPQKTVEYNFVIHPKGKISDIQLKFNGAETDLVNNKIQMNVHFGKMEETLPASWVEDGTSKKEVAVEYRKIKKDVYGFTSTNLVSDKTVIIDPVPIRLWGTYYGGEGEENNFNGIVKTNNQFVYIGGYTTSVTNISTTGSYQPSFIYADDAFITKFDPNGQRVWSTYYGGSHRDIFRAIDFDLNDNIYAIGITGSTNNIATPGTHQTAYNDWYDAMLIKFDSNGQRIWGTYYGGEGIEEVTSIKIDYNQDVIIAGGSHSKNNITTANSFKPVVPSALNGNNQGEDGFLAKFTSNGQRIWATYYGGNDGHDWISSIDIDSNNNIFCSGTTSSFQGIATSGSYRETFNYDTMLWNDTFIVKFNTNGERLFGTYYGGLDYDVNSQILIDKEDNFIISGYTRSIDGIGKTNSFQPNNNGQYDSYLAKFSNNGNLIWSTFYGGEGLDGHWGKNSIAIDENNSIYFYSSGTSNNNISTDGSYQENLEGYSNLYIAKFKPNGERIWGTYYGGQIGEYSGDISYDKNGIFYISGWTYSNDGIATSNAFQKELNGTFDTFLVKFKDCESSTSLTSNSPICTGDSLNLKASGGTNYSWTGPNGFTSTDKNPTIPNTTIANSGEYSCLITGTGGCDDTKKITVVIGDVQPPVPDITTLPTITGDCNTAINTIPTATDACAGIITGVTTNPLSYALPGTYTIVWNYNDGNGNNSSQNQTVTITSQPLPLANTSQTFCIQENATLDDIAITGQNIKWYDHQTAGSLLLNTTLLQNNIVYYASQTINGCESARIPVTINIQNTLPPTGNINQPFCTGQNPTIANIQITGTQIKWYDTLNNGSLLAETTNLQNGKTYYASQTVNNCESTRMGVTVSIVNTPSAPTGNANQFFCKNVNATLSNIQISGQNIKWYDTNFAAAALPNTTLLENNRTYYASQTVGCESDRTAISVKVYDTALPTGNRNQQFCIDQNAAIANLNITGTALQWYDSATNGNTLIQTTLLQNGIYYVTQTLNNCESERLAVNVKIQDTQIPIADSPQTFCIQKNAKISNIEMSGQDIQWFESTSSTVPLSESTLLENGITYYASQTINNCEGDRTPVLINILGATTADCINFVEELPYPKFFTPNNDTHNDTWTIDFAYLKPNTGIRIFDRYGKFLKELKPNDEWDGTYIGQDMPASDYWFTVTRFNGTEYRGHFSLKR
ncbi:T9SS type B sorting domain-containing protein [Flavobacterium gyeonganense]|uniref:T9SS type B sorting domain-containing protein n=1 Tax=Flavobacterium gyeonganense TaxID=1310418 RepID=A0ABV5HG73_9FLAO|nr:T9SS type B sorting domain-containing protein [Flavobacterium gyeonganense]